MKPLCLFGALCLAAAATTIAGATSLVNLANPLQGTDSKDGFSHGNTYPEIALPFPENTWSPYTKPQPQSAFYEYADNQCYGIRLTHEPSIWMQDHATFALMPVAGGLNLEEKKRVSVFRHEAEIAQPSYYKVDLDTWSTTAEVTPTERTARLRFKFKQPTNSYVVLEVFKSGQPCSVEIIPSENKVIGITRNNSGAVPDNFGDYFVIDFDRAFTAYGTWSDAAVQAGATKLEGQHVGAYLKFDTGTNKVVECKTAASYISFEQAERSLRQEVGDASFDTIRQRAEKTWNDALGRVQVQGGSEEQRRTFYTCLYRSILFPHRYYDYDDQHQPIHASPYDGKVHPGVLYTDSGFWDTFRAAHPLYNLLYPEISAEILQSLITSYDESEWLPSWSSPGHREVMIGNHAFSLLADGWAKGVRNFDLQTAVKAVVHDAHQHQRFTGLGREEIYDRLGYVPYPTVGAGTSKTLEYAYDDYCAAMLAQAAGLTNETRGFQKNAMNYTNVFDAKTGFMRPRKEDGSWVEPFDPIEWGGAFTEGNSWQWTWSVMQDVPGLILLMGGDEAFADKLDAMFNAGTKVKVGTYGYMIHEMNEMVAQNLGQYAHGNEPVHHVLYLYDYAGQPWKTQARVRQAMSLLYQSTPDGQSGDEDTGEMSAWYVLSALGIYSVCPGDPNYLIGSPIFDQATINLANGKKFIITAKANGPQKYYIDHASLNGAPLNKVFISHNQIIAGGQLNFQMASFPNYHWAVGAESRPPAAISQIK